MDIQVNSCGTSTPAKPLDRIEAEQIASVFKAVADPTRLQLISFLRQQPGLESCVCNLADAVQLSQPTVSHHLKTLVEAGLLTRSKRGYWVWYTLQKERIAGLTTLLP